jgi:hypothetical protein
MNGPRATGTVLVLGSLLTIGQWLTLGQSGVSDASGSSLRWQDGRAIVRVIRRGKAWSSLDGAKWQELRIGDVLGEGALVKTDKKAVVDLFLKRNGPVLRLTPATKMAIRKLRFAGSGDNTVSETRFDLQEGGILGAVARLPPASCYEVTTTNGVRMAVEETRYAEYEIRASGLVQVLSGAVVTLVKGTDAREESYEVSGRQEFHPPASAKVVPMSPEAELDFRRRIEQDDFTPSLEPRDTGQTEPFWDNWWMLKRPARLMLRL